jgi:hypothetical protein
MEESRWISCDFTGNFYLFHQDAQFRKAGRKDCSQGQPANANEPYHLGLIEMARIVNEAGCEWQYCDWWWLARGLRI